MKKRYLLAAFSMAVVLAACGSSDTGGNSERGTYEKDEREEKDDDEVAPAEADEEEDSSAAASGKDAEEDSTTPAPEQEKDETVEVGKEKEEKGEKDPRLENRPNATLGTGSVKDLNEGDVAPDFTVKLVDGSSFTLSDHDDEVVLINFWASWCGPCVGEMPAFERLHADGDAVILGVNCAESVSVVNDFVRNNGYTYPIAYDTDYTVGYYYPTDGIPYTLVVDHGVIHEIFEGASDADSMYREYSSSIAECLK